MCLCVCVCVYTYVNPQTAEDFGVFVSVSVEGMGEGFN